MGAILTRESRMSKRTGEISEAKLSDRNIGAEKAFYRAQERADRIRRPVWFQFSKNQGWWVQPKGRKSKSHPKEGVTDE